MASGKTNPDGLNLIFNCSGWTNEPSWQGQLILAYGTLKKKYGWEPGAFGPCSHEHLGEEFQSVYKAIIEELHSHAETRSTIPDDAFVEVNLPPFVALQLREHSGYHNGDIGGCRATWVNREGTYFLIEFSFSYDAALPEISFTASAKMDDADVGSWADLLIPLTVSVIRDFWIIEDRERVLGPPRIKRVTGLRQADKRVIYLPRLRYVDPVSAEKRAENEMSYKKRYAYFRRDHYRKLPEGYRPSALQLALARAHHRNPPEGHTWVRGSDIAAAEDSRVYRSRSLAMALFDIIPDGRGKSLEGMTWYEFERRCEGWVREKGWTVLRKVGDNGIDILALRDVGVQPEEVVIQCKHWRDVVGPDVVRELAGARQQRRASAAILITTSAFTKAAIDAASALNVQLEIFR